MMRVAPPSALALISKRSESIHDGPPLDCNLQHVAGRNGVSIGESDVRSLNETLRRLTFHVQSAGRRISAATPGVQGHVGLTGFDGLDFELRGLSGSRGEEGQPDQQLHRIWISFTTKTTTRPPRPSVSVFT